MRAADPTLVPEGASEHIYASLWKPPAWWGCDVFLAMLLAGVAMMLVLPGHTELSLSVAAVVMVVGLFGLQALGRHDPHARQVYVRSLLYGRGLLAARALRGQRARGRVRSRRP